MSHFVNQSALTIVLKFANVIVDGTEFDLLLLNNHLKMKKIIFISVVFLTACKNNETKITLKDSSETVALAKGTNSDALSTSITKVMKDYYELKNSFVKEDTILIAQNAKLLSKDADLIPIGQMKADAAIVETAKTSAQSIVAQLQGLLAEAKLEEKRKDFQAVSEQMYDLIRTVQYDKEVVYHFTCSKAFNDNGANWLNNSTAIENPYLPKLTPACGDIIDSLDFRKK